MGYPFLRAHLTQSGQYMQSTTTCLQIRGKLYQDQEQKEFCDSMTGKKFHSHKTQSEPHLRSASNRTKVQNMMLVALIPGPKLPDEGINRLLAPVVQELKELGERGEGSFEFMLAISLGFNALHFQEFGQKLRFKRGGQQSSFSSSLPDC